MSTPTTSATEAASIQSWRVEQYSLVVVFPVLHEQADDFVALFLQQPCRDRGIHPARHADNDSFLAHTYPFAVLIASL
jgi:hypothetical protein